MSRRKVRTAAISLLILAALLGLWEGAIGLFEVPSYIVPAPSAIFQALVNGLSSGLYLSNLLVTMTEVVVGFGVGFALALVLGVLIALSPRSETYVYPYIIMFQSMPKVALAPVLVVWFGLGISSKIVNVALISFFPILVNTIAGLRSVDPDRVNLMRSLGADEWQIFKMLRLPNALPFIVAGVEVGIIMSLLGAIVAEFVGAEAGLGMLIQSMNNSLDVAGQFSILILLSALGLSLNKIVGFIGDRLLFWDPSRKAKAAARQK